MTFSSAIKSLADGMAAKPAGWGGYVKRTDAPPAQFSESTAYTAGTRVTYGSRAYVCKTGGAPAGRFDTAKWDRLVDIPHTLSFVERRDSDADGRTEYVMTATVGTSGPVTYGDPTGVLKMDGALFTALLDNGWVVLSTADAESARTGTSRW